MIDRLKPREYSNPHFGVIASGIQTVVNLNPTSVAVTGTWATAPTDSAPAWAIDGDFDNYTDDAGAKNASSQTGGWEVSFTSATVTQIHWACRGVQDDPAGNNDAKLSTWDGSSWTLRDTTPEFPVGSLNNANMTAYDRVIDGFSATTCTKIRIVPTGDQGGNSDTQANIVCITYQVA